MAPVTIAENRGRKAMRAGRALALAAAIVLGISAAPPQDNTPFADPGLLFNNANNYHDGSAIAIGPYRPRFMDRAKVLPGGPHGHAYLQLADDGVIAWRAAGNIYAQRGTLAFQWRARTPLGKAPFPIFRVGYGAHATWGMTWLRIDRNGHGIDAMVADASLARIRISASLPATPKPDEWLHIAFAWDETTGIKLYINGALAARKDRASLYDTALDQFGPHSRTIGPMQVQTAYQYKHSGDIAELKIYDHALADSGVAALTQGGFANDSGAPVRDLNDPRWRNEWYTRYGWNRPTDPPPYLTDASTIIRKVEFTDARDVNERMMGANDGIPETTWPGVYNRSRIPGRHDYIELPDWNVYVDGGKSVTFMLPNEPWNRLEVQGTADGTFTFQPHIPVSVFISDGSGRRIPPPPNFGTFSARIPGEAERLLAERPPGQERSFNSFATLGMGALRFENRTQANPLPEVSAFNVTSG